MPENAGHANDEDLKRRTYALFARIAASGGVRKQQVSTVHASAARSENFTSATTTPHREPQN
jgi:hypothetical protein